MKAPPKMPPLPGAGEKKQSAPPPKPALEEVAILASSGEYRAAPASATDTSGPGVNVSPDLVRQNLPGIDQVIKAVEEADSPIAKIAKSMGMTVEQYREMQAKIAAEEKRREDERKAEEARIAANDQRIERENAELADWKDQARYFSSYHRPYVEAEKELRAWEEELQKARTQGPAERTARATVGVRTWQEKTEAARALFAQNVGAAFSALVAGNYALGTSGPGAQRYWTREVAPYYREIEARTRTVPDVDGAWRMYRRDQTEGPPRKNSAWDVVTGQTETPKPASETTNTPATLPEPQKTDPTTIALVALAAKLLFF